MNHLTDEKIQSYLDGDLSDGEIEQVDAHVKECLLCQNEIASYKALYSSLGKECGFELDVHFSHHILDDIEKQYSENIQEKLFAVFMALFGVIAVLTTSFYYVDFTELGNDLKLYIPGFSLPDFGGIFTQVQNFFPETSLDLSLLFVSAIVLLALAAFDRFVLQNNNRISAR